MSRRSHQDEEGFTVAELVVASMILMAALVGFFGSLAAVQRTSSYEAGRTRALDDMRVTASAFAKDARHAVGITSASASQVVMTTYVGGVEKSVTYRVVTTGGETNLERLEQGGAPRLFVIRLTDSSIFTFTPDDLTAPEDIRLVGIHMETKPTSNDPAVVLATEVLLRNVEST